MSNALAIIHEFASGAWSYRDALRALVRRGWTAHAASVALRNAV